MVVLILGYRQVFQAVVLEFGLTVLLIRAAL